MNEYLKKKQQQITARRGQLNKVVYFTQRDRPKKKIKNNRKKN